MRKGFRQGDILFRPTAKVKGGQMQPRDGRYTVALGEQTGHHHSIPATTNVAVFLDPDGMTVQGQSKLVHQEHSAQGFHGDYEVVEQRRASPFDHKVLRPYD
jgi:hypothetical protein